MVPRWPRFRGSFILGEEMSSRDVPADFKCSKSSARYKVVRVKPEPQSPNWLVHCKLCKEPLAAMDGEDILKHFLTADRAQFAVETGTNSPLFVCNTICQCVLTCSSKKAALFDHLVGALPQQHRAITR